MLGSFLIVALGLLGLVILRAYSIGADQGRSIAKSEQFRLQEETPDAPLAQLPEDDFIAYFEWLRLRRFWLYLVLYFALTVAATGITFVFLNFVDEVIDPGPWVWGFVAIFSLVITWAGTAFATLWLHSTRRAEALESGFAKWRDMGPGMEAQAVESETAKADKHTPED